MFWSNKRIGMVVAGYFSLYLFGCGTPDDVITRSLVDASARGDDMTVAELLLSGANPNLADGKEGPTPLVIAASRCNESVIRLLVVGGAKINRSAVPGTPLYAAALSGQEKCVVLLKKLGGKLNINEAQAQGLRRTLREQKWKEIEQLLSPEI